MKKFIISLITLFVIFACASKNDIERDAATYFKEGLTYFQNKKYEKAAILFEEALKKADTPELAAKAQLFLADSYYFDRQYEEAISAYKSYLELYEDKPDAKRALLRLGLSYYAMLKPIDRDQSYTREAYKIFLELNTKYPDFAKEYNIQDKISHLKNMLAEKDLYVAKFYIRIGEKKAALIRLKKIINEYKDTKVYPDAALLYAKVLIDNNKLEMAVSILNQLLNETKDPKLLPQINKILKDLKKQLG